MTGCHNWELRPLSAAATLSFLCHRISQLCQWPKIAKLDATLQKLWIQVWINYSWKKTFGRKLSSRSTSTLTTTTTTSFLCRFWRHVVWIPKGWLEGGGDNFLRKVNKRFGAKIDCPTKNSLVYFKSTFFDHSDLVARLCAGLRVVRGLLPRLGFES